ncbi:TetR/AcrR family transcriptional regulator [Candidatus Poriferisodalis sp.]|uniref:TetR/AcrR family transcriptional regulator n=1 Tax=Candidatus Poriferisodalis sp. TaxID=3101277 RepID=UPI003B02A297
MTDVRIGLPAASYRAAEAIMAIEPTTPKGRRTRQTILDAASTVFTKDGYVDARMSDVAAEAGLSLGGLYRYFENKEDLFSSVIRDIHEELFRRSRSSTPIGDDPEAALFEANLGYLQHYRDNRGVMRAFIAATTVEQRFTTIWWTMRERHVARFVHAIENDDRVRLDGLDPATVARAMASLVEQTAYTTFAHDALNTTTVDVKTVARIVTRAWYRSFYGEPDGA